MSLTRIYFDPYRLRDVFPDADESKEGIWGVRAMIVTPDGTVYHYMNSHGARRRLEDFTDALHAGANGQFADFHVSAADLLEEMNPNGRAF